MMPLWTAPSEVWMQRMLEELGDDLGTVVAWNTAGETSWRGRARAVALRPRRSLFDRLLARLSIRSPKQILLREIRRPGISHILCHYGEFAVHFMDVWRTTNMPLFIHFHGFDATFDLRSVEQPGKSYYTESYRRDMQELARRATLIANSEFTKSLLINAGIPADRIQVKHLGVPVPAVERVQRRRDEIHILHLGRLVDFKSPDRTIKAFEIARSKGLRGYLTIAGDGPLRMVCEQLRAESPYMNSIHLIGAVTAERAQELLADADIYTQHNTKGEFSRQEECFGVSILEAMAAGIPVVGTRSGGVLETVVDGETGILVDPGDVEGQAEAMLRLSKDPALRQQLGDAGQKRVAEYFNMEREAERLRAIIGLGENRHHI